MPSGRQPVPVDDVLVVACEYDRRTVRIDLHVPYGAALQVGRAVRRHL